MFFLPKTIDRTLISPRGNEDIQQLINILGKYDIKVTFFVVGDWVDKYPESVQALHEAGHEIMNHSNHHAHFNSLSSDEIVADINACSDKIEAITGVRPPSSARLTASTTTTSSPPCAAWAWSRYNGMWTAWTGKNYLPSRSPSG